MKISIVVATYNDPSLKQCLESIYRSENADFEAIVVDDGSTKTDIKKITDDFPKCRTFVFGKNRGPAAARNFGAKMAEGNIVFFMDSDAQLYPDTLQRIAGRFENDPSLQGLTIVWSDEAVKNNFFNKFKAAEGNYTLTRLDARSFGSNGSAIYKNLFLEEGGFDENFKTANAEDFYMGLKLFERGYKIDLDKNILMKNSYLDKFFFQGFKKYFKRAFLRAIVIYQTKDKIETSYNSKKFKILYFFSGLIFVLLVTSFVAKPLIWFALIFFVFFSYLNRELYLKFYKKYGLIFAVRAVILHYFYILIISIAGIFGLIYALFNSLDIKIKKYFRWIKFFFSNTPFYAIFYITSQCNARCSHCFNWRLVENAPNRKELSLEEIEKIAKNWGDMLILNLAGGEPFIRNDVPEIVRAFKKYTGVEIIAIPSNGFLTEKIVKTAEKLLNDFPDIHFRFTFSIDGLYEKHDQIRKVAGGFGKAIETVRQIKELKKKYKNFSLFTNSCFMQPNQDNLIEILKFIKENLDVDAMSVTYIRGDAKSSETQKNLYIQKYKDTINYLSELNREKFKNHPLANFIWAATILARKKVLENLETGRRNFECYAIKKMTVIDDTGEVKICEILPTSLGNLREADYDIKKIVTSEFANSEYEKIKKHQCNCTWECAIRTGIIYNPREYFSLLKYAIAKKDKVA